uniref:Uncharacterized protein n=1 Tax=Anguilla anguilla TaxID=7936 RepID=A0A0E9T9Q7_ANGAN
MFRDCTRIFNHLKCIILMNSNCLHDK